MNIFDISLPLRALTPVWPNEKRFSRTETHTGSICVSEIAMGLHTATHVDAAKHFLPEGKSIDEYPLQCFAGQARVCEISNPARITRAELLQKNLAGVEKVLFKTANSLQWDKKQFVTEYVSLDLQAAQYLVEIGVSLVGCDYLSIEEFDAPGNPVHLALLRRDILILEGLNLAEVPEGDYFLSCSPLKIEGAEASPVRAFLAELPVMERQL